MTISSSRIVPSADAFAISPAQSGGLSLRVQGGYLLGGMAYLSVPNVHVTLADNATTYVEVSAVGRITSNTTAFTDGAVFLYVVTTLGGVVVSIADWRASPAVPANAVVSQTAHVTLTDDDIKALPVAADTATLIPIVPPTEIYHYGAGAPLTELPIPQSVTIWTRISRGVYTNINVTAHVRFVYGADESLFIAQVGGEADPVSASALFGGADRFVRKLVETPSDSSLTVPDVGNFRDNGIYLQIDNRGNGALEGGDPLNTAIITMAYTRFAVPV